MKKLLDKILDALAEYYNNQFYKDLKTFNRPFILSYLLICARQIFYFLLIWNRSVIDKLIQLDSNFSKIKELNLTEMNSSYDWSVYVSSWILFSMIFLFGYSFLTLHLQFKITIGRTILSVLCMCYNYIFFVPLLAINLAMVQVHPLAIANLPFIFFFNLLISIHDQDFHIIQGDFLAKRSPLVWDLGLSFLETLSTLCSALFDSKELILLANLSIGVYRLLNNFLNSHYNNRTIRILEQFMASLHTVIVLTLFLSVIYNQAYGISILLLLWIPTTLKAAQLLETYSLSIQGIPWIKENAMSFRNKQELKNGFLVDSQLRMIFERIQCPIENYKTNPISVIFETFLYTHSQDCEKLEGECPLCEYTLNQTNVINESYIDGHHRKKCLNAFIIEQYSSYLCKDSLNSFMINKDTSTKVNSFLFFSYIFFLAEVEKSKVLSFIEMIRIHKKLKLSVREKMFLNNVQQNISVMFDAAKQSEGKGIPEIESAKTADGSKRIDPEKQDYLLGIRFDEELRGIEEQYLATLKLKEKLFVYLSEDSLDLIELKDKSITVLQQREEVKKRIKALAEIDSENSRLQFYMENFVTYLGFADKKNQLFFQNKAGHSLMHQKKPKMILESDVFSKDNCVVFITLIDNIGTIRRMQNKFELLFGLDSKQSIGKNINIIMPSIIGKYHNKILENYVMKSGKNTENRMEIMQAQSKGLNKMVTNIVEPDLKRPNIMPLLLARNNKGWGVAVSLNFKADNISLQDCGLTGHLKIINKEYIYLMTNCKTFQLQLISQTFFDKVLNRYVEQNDVYKVYLNQIIPLLPYFEKQWINNETGFEEVHRDLIKTIAFLPKQEGVTSNIGSLLVPTMRKVGSSPLLDKVDFSKLQKDIKKFSIEKYDMFQIKMKFYHNTNEFTQFNIVEIQQMWKITTPNLQRDGLLMLKGQLKALLNIDYDIQSDINILFKLEELSYYQIHASSNDPMSNITNKTKKECSQRLTMLRSSWGFEEINDEEDEDEQEEMSEQSQDGSQEYEARTHTRFEHRQNAKRHPKEFQDSNGTHRHIGNGNSPHSNQKGGDVPQLDDVGNFFNITPPNEADLSHLAEASRRSPMVSTGGNCDSNQTNPDLNSQRLPARNDPRFGSKTFSTIPLGGEAPNFNQSTFFDTTKGDPHEGKNAHDIQDETVEEEKKNRIEDHSNMFIKIQYENEARFAEHVEDKHHDHQDKHHAHQVEEPPHLRLIGSQTDHRRQQLETPHNLELKKVDSAMSLLSVSQYPHLLEPTFISFANVPIVSNQNAVPELIGSSSFMLPQGVSNRDSSPQLHNRHHHPSQIHAQSMLQLHQTPQSQNQIPEKVYLKKHTQSQINVTSSQNQQQHGLNSSSQQHSPHNQSQPNSNHQIHSPNLIHSPSQSPQLLTPKTQATSYYGEKNKGIFYLLKEKLRELKKQKKSKSAATATTTALGLEDLTSELWTQKNTQNMKSTTHQFSSNPSLPLNNTASKENSQYLQSFLKSYYDVQSGSMTIIGKKKKGNHESWGQHDDSVESPDRKRKRITLAEEDDHQRQGAAGYMGGQSSELDSDSHKAGEHGNHEQRKKGRMQTNSVQTSQATSSEHKQSIRQMIISKHGQDRSLIQLRLFGFVAILAIVVLTIYSFVNTQNLFSNVKIHIDNIPWSNTLRAVFSFPFVYMSLKSILEVNAFGDSTLYSSDFSKTLAERSENDFYLMNNLLLQLQQQGTEGRDYFSYVVNQNTTFVWSQDDATVPTSVILTRDDTYKQHLTMSILQFVYLTVNYDRQAYEEGYKGPFHQKFIIDNFVTFISNMTTVQTKVQDRSQEVLNSISNSVTQLIILVTSVSFVLIFIVFPLYFFVQLRNEQVLKLLATIQPLTLQQMLRQISLGMFVFSLDSARTTPNDKVIKFKTDNIRKKKNISNTNTISKFKFIHLVIALVAFGIITIQPAVTVIITQQYIDEAQVNINLLGKLYNLIAQSASNMVVAYNYMNYKLVAAGRTYNPSYYLVRSNALVAGNENVLNDVSKIIQSSSGQTKRQQDLYQNFFYKFLNTNLCQALEEYPQYISAGLLDVSTCTGISSGILSQGFQVSMKKFLGSFADLNQVFNMPEASIIPGIQAWQKLIKIRDFDLFAEFLTRSIIVQKDFLVTVMTDDIDYISTVSIGLLLFQVILLGGIFSYFWHRIYNFISTEMFIIRNILTVLTIDAVVENPYIISYLTK